MDKVQGFIGLPRCLKNENFVFNETKGFYCILDKDGNQQCLDSNKGTSRKRLLKLNLTITHDHYNLKNGQISLKGLHFKN